MIALLLLQAAVAAGPDGRVLGHFPYGDVAPGELVDAPTGFGLHGCRVRADMLPDLQGLVAAADTVLGPGSIRGLSGHRSIERQRGVFAGGGQGTTEDRAISVAPAGHSEHTTGYAIDVAVRPSPNCPDIEACMAATPQARWLLANMPRFGFELSFPPGNRQGVKWEPWHWRWVGRTAEAPGAARARFVFAKARAAFPADPGLYPPLRIVVLSQPEPPPLPAPPAKKKRRKPSSSRP